MYSDRCVTLCRVAGYSARRVAEVERENGHEKVNLIDP